MDRDGTICEEVGYLNDVRRFRMFAFAPAAIRLLNQANLPVVVVTNQSGVGRGYFPESLVPAVHDIMTKQLVEQGARVDAIYYCPHTSEEHCACRKPKPGMLQRAAADFGLDLRRSFLVGDRFADIEAAHAVGGKGVLVRTGYGEVELAEGARVADKQGPEFVADDLRGAVDWILGEGR